MLMKRIVLLKVDIQDKGFPNIHSYLIQIPDFPAMAIGLVGSIEASSKMDIPTFLDERLNIFFLFLGEDNNVAKTTDFCDDFLGIVFHLNTCISLILSIK